MASGADWALTLRWPGAAAVPVREIPRRDDGTAAGRGSAARQRDPGRAQRRRRAGGRLSRGDRRRPRRAALSRSAGCGRRRAGRCGSSPRGTRWSAVRLTERGGAALAARRGAGTALLPRGELAELLGRARVLAGDRGDQRRAARAPAGERGQRRPERRGRPGCRSTRGCSGAGAGRSGWLVIAEPVRPAELRALAEEVGARQRLAEGSADRFPERAVEARAAQGAARRGAARRHPPVSGGSRVLAGGCRRGERGAGRRAVLRVGGPGRAAVRAEPGGAG